MISRTRRLRVVAKDPSVRVGGKILTAEVDVPAENLAPGPRGHRVDVIDYDASRKHLYPPAPLYDGELNDDVIASNPGFHATNAYAIVMRTLARFERELGRHVAWSFGDHQIKVAPHAFQDANAFYSRRDHALLFGYFPTRKRYAFTCLSHDVVAHETTHAIVDGLRPGFLEPSSLDQAAFHEGFSDVVALLSVFALPETVKALLLGNKPRFDRPRGETLPLALRDHLSQSLLTALGPQIGAETLPNRSPLRRSISIDPKTSAARVSPHDRGEVLVAAITDAFLSAWVARLTQRFIDPRTRFISADDAVRDGVEAANLLLTLAIRALDYCPPVHLEFGTFLSAMITAHLELRGGSDDTLGLRAALIAGFAKYGVPPASKDESGSWCAPKEALFSNDRVHFEQMQRDPDEVFRFCWENRDRLSLHPDARTSVDSVRPCVRISPDSGFFLRETVVELTQELPLWARELHRYGVEKPDGMPNSTEVRLVGGVTLVFDDYGHVKYDIGDSVLGKARRQSQRLASLWRMGHFRRGLAGSRRFAALHQLRAASLPVFTEGESW